MRGELGENLVYREMTVAGFLRAVQNTAALTGVLLFIFTAASAFSWVLTIADLPVIALRIVHVASWGDLSVE